MLATTVRWDSRQRPHSIGTPGFLIRGSGMRSTSSSKLLHGDTCTLHQVVNSDRSVPTATTTTPRPRDPGTRRGPSRVRRLMTAVPNEKEEHHVRCGVAGLLGSGAEPRAQKATP